MMDYSFCPSSSYLAEIPEEHWKHQSRSSRQVPSVAPAVNGATFGQRRRATTAHLTLDFDQPSNPFNGTNVGGFSHASISSSGQVFVSQFQSRQPQPMRAVSGRQQHGQHRPILASPGKQAQYPQRQPNMAASHKQDQYRPALVPHNGSTVQQSRRPHVSTRSSNLISGAEGQDVLLYPARITQSVEMKKLEARVAELEKENSLLRGDRRQTALYDQSAELSQSSGETLDEQG